MQRPTPPAGGPQGPHRGRLHRRWCAQRRPRATATTAAAPAAPTVVPVACAGGWLTACERDRLSPGRGVAVLLPDGGEAALFRDRSGAVRAISDRDPFTGAYVLSRGLLGSADGRPFVASPLLKQRFDLATGVCLDDEEVSVPVYAVRLE
ncbi:MULTISPECIES: nitrite reductase small subunit NirD [unclassified Streptomyces]|uniref:nitrite reductase small subunit NirD n=1 Tax=unclassified Streptomyces TaxID=2593676 RepID=UPI003687DC64